MNYIGLRCAEGNKRFTLRACAFVLSGTCVLAIARDCGIFMSWLVLPIAFVGGGVLVYKVIACIAFWLAMTNRGETIQGARDRES